MPAPGMKRWSFECTGLSSVAGSRGGRSRGIANRTGHESSSQCDGSQRPMAAGQEPNHAIAEPKPRFSKQIDWGDLGARVTMRRPETLGHIPGCQPTSGWTIKARPKPGFFMRKPGVLPRRARYTSQGRDARPKVLGEYRPEGTDLSMDGPLGLTLRSPRQPKRIVNHSQNCPSGTDD